MGNKDPSITDTHATIRPGHGNVSLDTTFCDILDALGEAHPYILCISDIFNWRSPVWVSITALIYINSALLLDTSLFYLFPCILWLLFTISGQSVLKNPYASAKQDLVSMININKSLFYLALTEFILPSTDCNAEQHDFQTFLSRSNGLLVHVTSKLVKLIDHFRDHRLVILALLLLLYIYVPLYFSFFVLANTALLWNCPFFITIKSYLNRLASIYYRQRFQRLALSTFTQVGPKNKQWMIRLFDPGEDFFYDCYDHDLGLYTRVYYIYENQRYWPGIGWLSEFFGTERKAFSNQNGTRSFSTLDQASKELCQLDRATWICVSTSFGLNLENSSEDPLFTLFLWSREKGEKTNTEWEYGDTNWRRFSDERLSSSVTRRRLQIFPCTIEFNSREFASVK